jgi:hypothetical protein
LAAPSLFRRTRRGRSPRSPATPTFGQKGLGLGDTETPAGADWTLPAQAIAVLGLLDRLELDRVAVVGHDQAARSRS